MSPQPLLRMRHQKGQLKKGARTLPDGTWNRYCQGPPASVFKIFDDYDDLDDHDAEDD